VPPLQQPQMIKRRQVCPMSESSRPPVQASQCPRLA
jgi:hypothetical protein